MDTPTHDYYIDDRTMNSLQAEGTATFSRRGADPTLAAGMLVEAVRQLGMRLTSLTVRGSDDWPSVTVTAT